MGANRRSMTGRRNPLRDLLLLGRVPPSVVATGGTGCAPYSAALGPNRDLAAGVIARNPSSNCRIPGIGYRISLHLAVSRGHRSPGLLPGRDFRIALAWSPVALAVCLCCGWCRARLALFCGPVRVAGVANFVLSRPKYQAPRCLKAGLCCPKPLKAATCAKSMPILSAGVAAQNLLKWRSVHRP